VAFGLGLAVAIEWLVPHVKKHALLVVSLALVPFVLWNMSLMALYSRGAIPLDVPVSFRQAAQDAAELVYQRTGYPFSWPGAWAARYRAGTPLAIYDLEGAQHLSHNVHIRMGDTDALYLGPGWSLPQRGREHTVRQMQHEGASIYVALREPAPYRLEIEGRSEGAITVTFREHHLGSVDLGEEWGTEELSVPREAVAVGLNRLVFKPATGRRAFVSRLSLIRPGQP
jgi:hypothetical protein